MDIRKEAEQWENYIIEQRRWFHRHPELPYKEKETTEAICRQLKEMDIEVITFPDYYGAIGIIEGGQPGPCIMLRADIDALPVEEHTNLPFASENQGVMHACGHDCHIAMALGAAKILSAHREKLQGTVKILFQSAEEDCHGSTYYVEKGCLEGVDAIFGLHIWGTLPSPYFALHAGGCMASCDNFQITVRGTSAHGSAPHLGHDAIAAAASIVMNLQTMVSRRNNPQNALVVTVGTIHGGQAFNILANKVVMEGTCRTYSREIQATLEEELKQIVVSTAQALGCEAEFSYRHCFPSIINENEELNEIVHHAAVSLYGEESIREMEPLMSSDDFSRFAQKVPGYYGYIGAINEACNAIYPNHNDCFTVDEAALKRGAALYAQVAVNFLKGHKK